MNPLAPCSSPSLAHRTAHGVPTLVDRTVFDRLLDAVVVQPPGSIDAWDDVGVAPRLGQDHHRPMGALGMIMSCLLGIVHKNTGLHAVTLTNVQRLIERTSEAAWWYESFPDLSAHAEKPAEGWPSNVWAAWLHHHLQTGGVVDASLPLTAWYLRQLQKTFPAVAVAYEQAALGMATTVVATATPHAPSLAHRRL